MAAGQIVGEHEEPKADMARCDRRLKKLAVAAIAAMPILMAAVSNRAVEVPCGTA